MPSPSRRHGRAILIVTATAALVTATSSARAQFSPGPLSRSHAALDKPTACLECHEPKRAATPGRCLACHGELAARIRAGRGYHGRDKDRATQCASCHAEHGGREAVLIAWPGERDSFDHSLTGYPLDGKHAAVHCRTCHTPALIGAAGVRAGKSLRLDTTYLGLPTRCAECHGDVHRGQFEARVAREDCAACHTTQAWRPVSVDHEKTCFPLTGRHAQVRCEGCHRSMTDDGASAAAETANAFVRYHPVPHDACVDCHTDPHRNRYGADCTRCHTTAGWAAIAVGTFDHDRTRYPLLGLHRRVACERCHAGGEFKKRIAFARCADCHSDRHGGQLAKSASAGACDACHSVEGFAPARYGVEEHQRTRFALKGAHLAVACISCHRATAKDAPPGSVQFRLKAIACADCHEDGHAGQFAASRGGAACARCHGERAWREVFLNHAKTRFPLEGAHARAACAACHKVESVGSEGRRTFHYRPLDTACRACHATLPSGNRRST